MSAIDVLMWIVIGGAIFIVAIMFFWSLCSIAKLSDESSEEYWEKYLESEKEEEEVKYIIVGDTDQYKGCLVMSCGGYKENAESTLERLLSDPDEHDKIMIEGYSNLRVEEADQKDCWWEE